MARPAGSRLTRRSLASVRIRNLQDSISCHTTFPSPLVCCAIPARASDVSRLRVTEIVRLCVAAIQDLEPAQILRTILCQSRRDTHAASRSNAPWPRSPAQLTKSSRATVHSARKHNYQYSLEDKIRCPSCNRMPPPVTMRLPGASHGIGEGHRVVDRVRRRQETRT